MKERKSGLELLRIVAIIFIILAHINNRNIGNGFGYVDHDSVNYTILMVIEASSLWTVSAFMLISGYFMSTSQDRSLTKVLTLIFQLICFNELKYIMTAYLIGEELQLRYFLYNLLPTDYYVMLYTVLYIVSPYINIVLSKIDKVAFNKLLLTTTILFPIWHFFMNDCIVTFNSSLNGMSTIGLYGNQEGYTIITFIYLYLIGAYIRKYNIKIHPIVCILITAASVYCIYYQSVVQLEQNVDISAWYIDNPFSLLVAISMFLLFKDMNISSAFINQIGKSVFTTYLIQDFIVKRIVDVEYIVAQPWFIMIGLELVIAYSIILSGYILYKLYNLLTNWFFKLIQPVVDILNLGVHYE